jgi:Helix-turn-helix domain
VLLELTVAEQRFNAVMEVLRDGLKMIEVAERYGVSRQTVLGWLRRYRSGGLEALANRSYRPPHCPHQMPAADEARLCGLRATILTGGQRLGSALSRYRWSVGSQPFGGHDFVPMPMLTAFVRSARRFAPARSRSMPSRI